MPRISRLASLGYQTPRHEPHVLCSVSVTLDYSFVFLQRPLLRSDNFRSASQKKHVTVPALFTCWLALSNFLLLIMNATSIFQGLIRRIMMSRMCTLHTSADTTAITGAI
jgi:hypothetical protein